MVRGDLAYTSISLRSLGVALNASSNAWMTSLSSLVTWPSAHATLTSPFTMARSCSCMRPRVAYAGQASTCRRSLAPSPGNRSGEGRRGDAGDALQLARELGEAASLGDD